MRSAFTVLATTVTLGAVLTPAGAGAAPGHGGLGDCSPSVSLQGFTDSLDKSTFDGAEVGGLSSLATQDGEVLAVADHPSTLYSLNVRRRGGTMSAAVTGQLHLADEQGHDLDAEGLAVDADGTRLVSSEIEPSVRRYDATGHILERLPVPDRFRTAPAGEATANTSLEGLTLLPGDRDLVATMEGPLSGDHAAADGAPLVRFLRWHKDHSGRFGLAGQYGFAADPGLGISEARAVSPTQLLILERGFTKGYGNTIRLYLADLRGASDVTTVADLSHAPTVHLVRRTLLADLARCPSAGATAHQPQPNPLLDNIEGMTLTGRTLTDGRRELLLTSDDNLSPAQITRLYALAVRLPRG